MFISATAVRLPNTAVSCSGFQDIHVIVSVCKVNSSSWFKKEQLFESTDSSLGNCDQILFAKPGHFVCKKFLRVFVGGIQFIPVLVR